MKEDRTIFGKGTLAVSHFTGEAGVKMLSLLPSFDCLVYNVTFAPGTRNDWHKHSIGQILLCIDGKGYYQEQGKKVQLLASGDVVEIPAGVIHWHGATPDTQFTHIGITPRDTENTVEWLTPVTDEEYYSLNRM